MTNNTALGINASAGSPVYAALVFRQAMSSLIVAGSSRVLGTNSGYTPGRQPTLSATSTVWTIGAFAAIIDAAFITTQGPYLCAADGNNTGAITAADATNPRVDILYAQVSDTDVDSSGGRTFTVAYLAGTAAASPSAPATPARSFLLATINVPHSGAGSPTIAVNNGFCVAAGGILVIPNLASVPATPYVGMYVETFDTHLEYKWDGTSWHGIPAGLIQVANSAGVTGVTTGSILASVGATLVAGRKYRVSAYMQGSQVSATGIVNVSLSGTSGVPTNILFLAGVTAGGTVYGSTVAEFTPGASGGFSFQIVGSTTAGTLSATTATQIMLEDIGT